MKKEPKRPLTVPAAANWNEAEQEWELGGKKKGEKYIGHWQWWKAPKGHLVCESDFDEKGNLIRFKRFHPDQSLSSSGSYKNGMEHGLFTYVRCSVKTPEYFVEAAEDEKRIWKAEVYYEDGFPVKEKYFDKKGDKILHYYYTDGPEPIPEKIKKTTTKDKTVDSDRIQKASKRWIQEGRTFKNSLRKWLDIIYLQQKRPFRAEPKETRHDMADIAISCVKQFNASRQWDKLRELFPPDYDPLYEKYESGLAQCVLKVACLPGDKIACNIGQIDDKAREVYVINGNEITREKGISAFGYSENRKYFAKAYADKIVITEGWDGPVKQVLSYPSSYGKDFEKRFPEFTSRISTFSGRDFKITNLCVFSHGNKVAMASAAGVFVIDKKGSQFIHPLPKSVYPGCFNNRKKGLEIDCAHVAISPDDRYLAVGSKDSDHIIFEKKTSWKEIAWIEPRCAYPNIARFNYEIKDDKGKSYPQIALGSCHFDRSGTIGLPLHRLRPGFKASGFDGDKSLDYIDNENWLYSILNTRWGYFLGSNNGYIWARGYKGKDLGYLHVGGTVMDMDISGDKKKLVVASYAGQVIVYTIEGNIIEKQRRSASLLHKNDLLITDLPLYDSKRYLFWKNCKPMIW